MQSAEPPQSAGQPLRAGAPGTSRTTRMLLALVLTLALGGVVIWQLRQDWAKEVEWPWALLVVVMILGAFALRRLEPWLPGEPMLARAVAFPARRRRILGAICIGVALALIALLVIKLWPDYHQWDGTLQLWLAALVLMVVGAWLVGAVGEVAPRAASAITLWRDTPRNRRLEILAFLLILGLAIFLRTYRIDSIPPGIYVDETNGGLDALRILEGNGVSPFATGWYETPNGYLYYMAAVFKVLGANWIALKVVSLLPAILTIPAIYLLGRLLFGPITGLASMLLLAVSRWHLSMSRWGWNETAPPFFQIMSIFFLVRGLRDRRALDYALGGLLMGLSVYTYLSSRLAAATIALYVIYWFISEPGGLRGIRAAIRRSWLGIVVVGIAAFIAVAPIGVTYVTDPFILNNRVSEISVFRDISDAGGSLDPLIQNISDMLKFFHQTGDHQGKHNLPDEPMTDPITGLLFAIGFAYAIFALRDQRRGLLLLWLVIGLAGSYLSSHSESPQSYRSLTALPAVILMAGDVLDRLIRALYKALGERKFSSVHPRLPLLAASGLAVFALAGSGLWETNLYFNVQATSIAVIRGFNATENQVAHETINALDAGKTVYLSPNFSDFSPLQFLVYGVYKAKTGESTLDNRPYHVVLPEVNFPLPDDGHDALVLLDSDYYPLSDYFASFYPQAKTELVTLSDNSPIYMRMEVPQAQLAALQGLTEQITYKDGRQDDHAVAQVEVDTVDPQIASITWTGAILLEHGGSYQLSGTGLQVSIDGQPWTGQNYLGRGLYSLSVVWSPESSGGTSLLWKMNDQDAAPLPPNVLFRVTGPRQGLLGTYYPNINWEGAPVFSQVTPFLLLDWPDEQPIVSQSAFSARYTGALRVTDPGTYSLRVDADDGARLTLDGKVLGEGLIPNQPNGFVADVDLTAGDHPIQIDYFQAGGGSALKVYWKKGDVGWTPIPPAALVPAQP